MLNCHALFGRYLFVKYSRNDLDDPDGISCKDYLYVRSVKGSSAEYNVQYLGNELSWTAGVVDDESGKNEYRIYLVRVKR